MGVVNEIQVGRFNGILRKLFSLSGDAGAAAPVLGPEVIPVVVLEQQRPEHRFLGGARLCGGWYSVAAPGVGLYAQIGLENPANSGVLAVCTKIIVPDVVGGATTLVGIQTSGIAPAGKTTGFKTFRDSRFVASAAGSLPTCNTIGNSIAVTPTAPIWTMRIVASNNAVLDIPEGIVLGPNAQLVAWIMASNTAHGAGFIWEERMLEPAETR